MCCRSSRVPHVAALPGTCMQVQQAHGPLRWTCHVPQLRNLGVDLPFTFMADAKPADPRFAETAEEVAYWEQVGRETCSAVHAVLNGEGGALPWSGQ